MEPEFAVHNLICTNPLNNALKALKAYHPGQKTHTQTI